MFTVDGQEHYSAVYDALEKATWQILMCGWWISPELYLKRPINNDHHCRLDNTIDRAAKRGVKIFVLVYKESSAFLYNDSAYVKEKFESMSSNIKVLQHPLGVLPSLWSHH
jgi:phospholipase D1/2